MERHRRHERAARALLSHADSALTAPPSNSFVASLCKRCAQRA
jgi:hypothetical protein